MKVALVHELLTMRGGAERVLKIIADIFPEAPIYTLLYDERKLGEWFPAARVRPSYLQRYAGFSTNHHLYLKHLSRAVEAWDFSEFDVVISSSSAFAHGIITNSRPKHLCYVHSPARYLWDRTHDVVEQAGHGLFGSLKQRYLRKLFHDLRIWDSEAAHRPDMLIAASAEVQRRIELYWRRESTVLHPPVDDGWFYEGVSYQVSGFRKIAESYKLQAKSYYLIVSTLARYKRIDLAIEAANKLQKKLVIAGEGTDRRRLEKIAGPTIEFVGYQSQEKLRDLYANAIATIFPGEEDFGLVPIESMACGTPVIACGKGGALETITEGKTGIFFHESNPQSLIDAMKRAESMQLDPDACKTHAKKWSRSRFEEGLMKAIAQIVGK